MLNSEKAGYLSEFPFINYEGTVRECGEMLGDRWRDTFIRFAAEDGIWYSGKPWWRDSFYKQLIEKYAPHLPELFCAIAKGAKLPENSIGSRVMPESAGCTSFAVNASQTLHGEDLCGQTKDTPRDRLFQYCILALDLKDAPSMLTLTYPGWLFGHGFASGGCAIFRNSLYAGDANGKLGYAMWGLLAQHCHSVDDAVEIAMKHGITTSSAHCTLQDCNGGIAGIEIAKGGIKKLSAEDGIYVHTNHVVSGNELLQYEDRDELSLRNSKLRLRRLRELLCVNKGRITPQTAMYAMTDHENYPYGICNHVKESYQTTAAVVAEPAKGLLHVTHGAPCCNWPQTYSLNV